MPTIRLQEQARPEIDELEVKARVREILNRHPAVGLAVGVVRNGSLQFFSGHGLADIASNRPVTQDTVFRIASITKTFTAIAVMQLWEQGLVDLDAPANDYLRAYRLVPAKAGFRPATVRHLLTHTAGIAEQVPSWGVLMPDYGESVKVGRPLPTLARYYRGGLRIHAEPGTGFAYGDHGPATLGQLVQDVSGKPLDRYLREHIFEPLGMANSDLVRSDRVRPHLATGYKLGAGGPQAVTDREAVPAGAASVYSTTSDMARYVAALLGGGANQHGQVLKPETLATMFQPHYQPDLRMPGMGLGFFRGDTGGHLLVEHGGIMPGFNSQLLVAPDDGVGVLAFTNGASRAVMWLPGEMEKLLNSLVGIPDQAIRTDVAHHPEIWGDLCGWYYLPGRFTDLRARSMLGAGVEVFVRRGQLMLRGLTPLPALYRGFALHPDDDKDPCVFRMDLAEVGSGRVVFSREPGGGTTAVHLEFLFFPISLWKRPNVQNPRRWVNGALAAAAGVTTVAVRRGRRASRAHRPRDASVHGERRPRRLRWPPQ